MKKCTINKKIVSIIIVIVMFATLLPVSVPVMAEEDTGMNVTLHVYNGAEGGLNYDAIYMNYWQVGSATITNAEEEQVPEWGELNGYRYKLTQEEDSDWYYLNIQGSMKGFQFFNTDNSECTNGKGYESNMANYEGDL